MAATKVSVAEARQNLARLIKRAEDGELATCSIVWHELRFGVSRLPAPRDRRPSYFRALRPGRRLALRLRLARRLSFSA